MKTNQVMTRSMGKFSIEQRTKDAFFNATYLLNQWNEQAVASCGKSHMMNKKLIADYFRQSSVPEFVKTIMEREGLQDEKQVYVKSKANKGKNAGTWMHPMLFIDFAMWLNPSFKYDVLKFVYDQMIAYRNEAGDAYKELASAVASIVPSNFMKVAMKQIAEGLNWCIFNQHETAIRNQHGEESKMKRLFELERKVASLIEDGFIRSQQEVMNYLRKQWRKLNQPQIFTQTI